MSLKIYLANLDDADVTTRCNAVRVLGLMDETQALVPIRNLFKQETEPEIKKVIAWAGERIFAAHKAGYSTLDELFRVFKIDQEIEKAESALDAKLINQMDYSLSRDLNAIKSKGLWRMPGFPGQAQRQLWRWESAALVAR